jgi:hypothetical protein
VPTPELGCCATGKRKSTLNVIKEKKMNWRLKEEAPDRTVWGTGFGRGYGPVARQTAE